MFHSFLAGLTLKRALIVAVPVLFSLGASAGLVKGIEWLIESPRPKVRADLAEETSEARLEENRAGSASRAPASLSGGTRRVYKEAPPPFLDDSDRAPLSQSSIPATVVEENVNNRASFYPGNRASSATPDAGSDRAREGEQRSPASSSSPSYFGGLSSGLVITDTPQSSSGGSSGGSTGGGGASSDPESSSLSGVRAAGLSAGGFALTTTSSGHKVNASYGMTTNIVRATTSSGHEIRMNTPGVTAD